MDAESSINIVGPDDGIVTGKNIPAYTNTWDMTAVKPDGTVENRGIWDDKVSFFTRAGKEIIIREQYIQYKKSQVRQVEEVYRENLHHIRLTINTIGEEPHTDINYNNRKIWGKKVFKIGGLESIQQMSIPFSYELPLAVFDWHLWGVLVSGFPLKINYEAKFLAHESYSYLPGDFRWFNLKVSGTDEIDAGKWGKVNCYTVEVKAEVLWKIWIAIDKNIAPVIQIRIDNTDGTQLWWKPLKIIL